MRFWSCFTILLGFPALLSVSASFAGHPGWLRHLAANYLWMAAPHLVLAVFAFAPRWRGADLLFGLVVLDVVLAAFWLWVRLAVPVRESALAWVLYLPVAGAALLLLAGCAVALRTRRTEDTTSS
jgi:hypothetical protein